VRAFDWISRELRGAQQRRPFRLLHFGLANEWLRAVSYIGAAIFVPLTGASIGRAVAVAVLASLLVVVAVGGIRSGGRRPQAQSAFADLVMTPTLVGAASGSPLFSWVTALFIATLMYVTIDLSIRVLALGVAIGSVLTIGMITVLSPEGGSGAIFGLAAFVAVTVALALGMLLFGWWRGHMTLKRKELELETILGSAPVMVATIDGSGLLASLAGRAPDSDWEPGRPVPAEIVHLVESAMAGTPRSADVDVGGRWYAFTASPAAHGATLTGFDVTDRELARASLEALVATKDRFVASISHELRTPLTAVVGFTEALRNSPSLVDEERAFIELVADQAAEMSSIIEDLLLAVRADLDIVTIVDQPVDLSMEVEAVCRSMQTRVSHPIFLDMAPCPTRADPVRVRQIVRNLVTNADRYGGGRIVVRTFRQRDTSMIEVRDDGPPIPDDRAERMFLAYESGGRDQAVPAAIGLGLAVSRRLAELMGGSLVYHHDGEWGVFRLSLPATTDRQQVA
jgi:two-component sensor histidine kinase